MMETKRILIVDDDETLRKGLSALLTEAGYEVLLASSGNEAFAILEKESVAMVLTDVRMQDGDGIDLIRAAKIKDSFVPLIIFMTGFSDLSLEEVYGLGATAILSKPFERSELLRLIERSFDVDFSQKPEVVGPDSETLLIKANLPEEAVGRGGFQVEFSPALRIGMEVRFRLFVAFGEQRLSIEGWGEVRWVKRGCSGQIFAGVEILFLEPESKLLYDAWLNVKRPVFYIPKAA